MSVPALASVEDEVVKGVDLFYDLQFDRAAAKAHDLGVRYPGYPAGSFYESVAAYQKYLLEDPPSAATFKQFEEASDKALEEARALASSSPAISHYYQGAVCGFQARAYVAQRRYAAAVPKARQGVAELQKAIQLDPSLIDAKLGLGMYYYFLSKVPPAMRPLAYMMVGMWGDRAKGIALMREVADKGRAAQREAQSILASIDASQREQKWDDALKLLQPLMERYPHNPRYRLKLIYVLQREGLWDKAAEAANSDGAWIKDLDPLIKARAQAVARYRSAESLIFADHWQEAVVQLDRLESEDVPTALIDWVALRRGNALDAQGRHADAAAYYSGIHDKKALGLAEIFLKTPYPAGPRDVMPSHWPVSNIPTE